MRRAWRALKKKLSRKSSTDTQDSSESCNVETLDSNYDFEGPLFKTYMDHLPMRVSEYHTPSIPKGRMNPANFTCELSPSLHEALCNTTRNLFPFEPTTNSHLRSTQANESDSEPELQPHTRNIKALNRPSKLLLENYVSSKIPITPMPSPTISGYVAKPCRSDTDAIKMQLKTHRSSSRGHKNVT